MTIKEKVFYFWGVMDALAILLYFINSFKQGRVPYFTDINDFSHLFKLTLGQGFYGVFVAIFFVMDIIFLLSLFVSAWLFYKKNPYAVRFSFAQELLRLVSFRCSVAFLPLILVLFGIKHAWMNLALFCLSEIVKVGSLIYIGKKE